MVDCGPHRGEGHATLRRWWRALGTALALASGPWAWVACAGTRPSAGEGSVAVAPVASLRGLSARELGQGRRVRLRGVVTHFSPSWRQMVVHDGTGGIAVDVEDLDALLVTRGSGVEGDGFLAGEGSLPIVLLPSVRRLGLRPLPAPSRVSIERVLSGAEDHQWVELEGRVIPGAMLSESRSGFELQADGQVLRGAAGAALDDAALIRNERVRVRGVPIPGRVDDEMGGRVLHIEGSDVFDLEGRPLPPAPSPPAAAAPHPGAPPLETVMAVKSLDAQAAAEGRPVRLVAVVTATLPLASAVIVQDSTGAIFASHGVLGRADLQPGLRVLVEARSATGEYAPILRQARLRVLGRGPLPTPVPPLGLRTLPPELENAYTEVRGVVQGLRRTSSNDSKLILRAAAGSVLIQAEGNASDEEIERLVDAEVVCPGVLSPIYARRELVGVQVLSRLADLRVLRPSPRDPFAAPPTRLGELRHYRPGASLLHRVRTAGTVTGSFHGGLLHLADGGAAVAVRAVDGARPAVGTRVDVAGFLAPGGRALLLESRVRAAGAASASPARSLSVGQALSGEHDSALVRIEGELLGVVQRRGRLALTLASSGRTFVAEIEAPAGNRRIEAIRAGSRIGLTGICVVEWDDDWLPPSPRGFGLRLRSPADVELLKAASWWTPGRALAGLGLLSALTLATGIWLTLTRRQVRTQTAVIWRQLGELEAKNAELERFAYTVSHDLKSPLVTIKGFLGLLKADVERGDLPRVETDIGRISSAADRLSDLLKGLLDLSRVGRVARPSETVALGPLLDDVLEQLAGPIRARDAVVRVAPELPVVRGDRIRLMEVFQNLLENALKFSRGVTRPLIEIGSHHADGEAVIFVRDNGPGIEPEYHERVFGLFERLDPGQEGAGLGLTLVRRIVEHHGGRIWIESAGSGSGATFCFTLAPPPVRGVPDTPDRGAAD